jgi:hypothetical protein
MGLESGGGYGYELSVALVGLAVRVEVAVRLGVILPVGVIEGVLVEVDSGFEVIVAEGVWVRVAA